MAVRGIVPNSLAHIAQAVEHFLGKEEVTGSSPVMGSSYNKPAAGHRFESRKIVVL